MACVSPRRGKWIVNYRDAAGKQRQPSFRTKKAAQDFYATVIQARGRSEPTVDPEITMRVYSEHWMRLVKPTIKPATIESYNNSLQRHILPLFGTWKLREMQRGRIKAFLAAKLEAGLSTDTVRIIHATMRAMFNAAIDDGALHANPAARLGKILRLVQNKTTRQEAIKALDSAQLAKFLAVAEEKYQTRYPLFLAMARTGMRIGEALALRWDDVDMNGRAIRIERRVDKRGIIDTPKSGHGRSVDMSQRLKAALESHRADIGARWLAAKTKPAGGSDLVFPTKFWTMPDPSNVLKDFKSILNDAGLPGHYSLHSLRHTYASLMLQQGESPVYVQRQLGHASIQLTVDTYGKWLPMGNKAAVDRLDSGGSLVADPASDPKAGAEWQ